MKDKEYRQIKNNEQQLNATFQQHYYTKGLVMQDLKNNVTKTPSYNQNSSEIDDV